MKKKSYFSFLLISFFCLTTSDVYIKEGDNQIQNGSFEYPFHNFEEIIGNNSNNDNYFIFLSSQNCSFQTTFSKNTSFTGIDKEKIVFSFFGSLIIEEELTLISLTINMNITFSCYNLSLLFIKPMARLNIINCNIEINIKDNCENLFFISNFANATFQQVIFQRVTNTKNFNLFVAQVYSLVILNSCIVQDINIENIRFITANNSLFLINSTNFKNIYSEKIIYLNSNNEAFLELFNSKLIFSFCNIIQSAFSSVPFINLVQSEDTIDPNNLNTLHEFQIIGCLFSNITFLSEIPFIEIISGYETTISFQFIYFMNFSSQGIIFAVSNCKSVSFQNITFFENTVNRNFYILNSDYFYLANCSFYTNNLNFLSDNPLESTALLLVNVKQKFLDFIIIANYSSYKTTPGIKIISYLKEPTYTLINNSLFSNNRMIYQKDYQSGAALYIYSDYEEIKIINSIIESNLVIPLLIIDRVGGSCSRNFGKYLQMKIFNSIFRDNQAAFGCNCLEFDGFYLEINNSLFLNNTNLIPAKDKYIIESIGYGGSIYFIGNNLTINFSQFIENMNYFGGNIYINGNMQRENLYIQVERTNFINNYAHSFGAAFYFADKVKRIEFYLLKSLIFRNWGNYNAAVFINFDSLDGKTYFFYDKFIENWSDFTGTIDFESQYGLSYINNSDFFNNTASWFPRDNSQYSSQVIADYGCGGAIGLNARSGKSQMFVYMDNNNFTNNRAGLKGSSYATIGGNSTIKNSFFAYNSAKTVSTFYIHINAHLVLENSTVLENFAFDQSCVGVKEFSYLVIFNCVFKNIKALAGKGMIYIDSLSEALICNSSFENISAALGSILFVKFNSNYSVKLINNIFVNNYDSSFCEEMFFVESSTNIMFEGNYFANNSNRLFFTKTSIILFKNNLIENISCDYGVQFGCVFSINQLSSFICEDSRVLAIKSKEENTFFYCSNSELNIKNTSINDVSCLLNAGFIGASLFSKIFIINSSFTNYFPGGIQVINSTQFVVSHSIFQKKTSIFEESSAIKILYGENILIEFSNFTNNFVSKDGGALNIICDNAMNYSIYPKIMYSFFTNNNATLNGGAISTQGCNIEINSSYFYNNHANIEGGALYFDKYSAVFLFNNSIEFNTAYIGGGIKYSCLRPVVSTAFFKENKAVYGENIASYAIRFNIQEYLKIQKINELIMRGRPSEVDPIFKNISLEIIDINNQTIRTMNGNSISISLVDSNNNKTSILSGNTKILIKNGYFNLSNIYFSTNITNNTHNFLITSSEISKYQKFNEFNLSSNEIFIENTYYLKIPLEIIQCEIGEVFIQSLLSCVKCSGSKYSLSPNATACDSCPPEAAYCDGNVIYLKSGYWRSDVNSTAIYACEPVKESCLGTYMSNCSIEYRGVLCQSCNIENKIYSKSFGNICVECSEDYAAILAKLVSGSVFLIIFYIVIIYSNLKLIDSLEINTKTGEISKNCKEKFYSPIYNKILMNYLQIVSLLKGIDLRWSSLISNILEIQFVAGNAPTYLYSFDCLVTKDSAIPSLYYKVIMTAITPIIGIILIFLYWKIKGIVKKVDVSNKLITSELVLLNILQPTVVNLMMKILSCKKINGVNYISSDLFYECYSNENLFYIAVFALPSLFIWIVIYPIHNLIRLRKVKSKLNQIETRKKLGFLYNSYHIKLYYWELIEIYKKYLVIFIIIFLQVNNSSKSLMILFILATSSYYLCTKKPYLTKDVNKVAFLADLVALSTLFFGLLSYSAANNVFFLNLSEIMIVLNNVMFLGYFSIMILMVYKNKLKEALKNYPLLKRLFFRFLDEFKTRNSLFLGKAIQIPKMKESQVVNVDLQKKK